MNHKNKGIPAYDMKAKLFRAVNVPNDEDEEIAWDLIQELRTDKDGRGKIFFAITTGVYKMVYYTQSYYQRTATPHFYPKAEITFRITDTSIHYHIPLLLSPYGKCY